MLRPLVHVGSACAQIVHVAPRRKAVQDLGDNGALGALTWSIGVEQWNSLPHGDPHLRPWPPRMPSTPLLQVLLGPALLHAGIAPETLSFVFGSDGSLLSDLCGRLVCWCAFYALIHIFYHIFAPGVRAFCERWYPDAPTSAVPQKLVDNMIEARALKPRSPPPTPAARRRRHREPSRSSPPAGVARGLPAVRDGAAADRLLPGEGLVAGVRWHRRLRRTGACAARLRRLLSAARVHHLRGPLLPAAQVERGEAARPARLPPRVQVRRSHRCRAQPKGRPATPAHAPTARHAVQVRRPAERVLWVLVRAAGRCAAAGGRRAPGRGRCVC